MILTKIKAIAAVFIFGLTLISCSEEEPISIQNDRNANFVAKAGTSYDRLSKLFLTLDEEILGSGDKDLVNE